MGLEWIEATLEALREAGIRAQRGFPAEKMPYLTETVAGVTLQQARADSVTVAVWIYGPLGLGGPACEDLAIRAAEALTALGGQCSIGKCEFDGKAGLFRLPVQAVFLQASAALGVEVRLNGVLVTDLTKVSTRYHSVKSDYTTDTGTGKPYYVATERTWRIQIEDLLPNKTVPRELGDNFFIIIRRADGTEQYEGCFWESITTEPAGSGLRRVRVALTCSSPILTVEE